jgi:hypothetical protein
MELSFSPGDPYYLPAVGVAAVAAGVFLLLSLRRLLLGLQSNRWKPGLATVESVSIEEKTDSDNDSWFRPRVKYSFTSRSGRFVRSNRVSYRSLSTMDYGDAAKNLTGVLPGKQITIYYNPVNPRQSVLIRGVGIGNYLEIVLLFIFLLFALNGIHKHRTALDQERQTGLNLPYCECEHRA